MKDLIDLVLVKQSMKLDAARLRTALAGIFEGRDKQPLPESLPLPPSEWKVPYEKLATEVGIDPDLSAGHREAQDFLDQILRGLDNASWDPVKGSWV